MRYFMRLGAAAALCFTFSVPGVAADWAPIDEDLLALSEPRLDPDADAEAIFWDVRIADRMQGDMPQTFEDQYVRIKIFTERGVEKYSTVDLATVRKTSITTLLGRTIKPDGTIVELEKATIFERDVVKAGDVRVRTRSFSMPNVEVGDIIEYQWREITDNSFANYQRLYFQRDIPTWKITYHVKPSEMAGRLGYIMQSQAYNVTHSGFQPEPQGYFATYVEDAPAFTEEPYMPPGDQVRSWLLLYYSLRGDTDAEKFWNKHGKELYSEYHKDMKPDGTIKKAVASIVDAADDDAAKVDKILQFCRTEIQDIYHDRFGVSAEQRADMKENKGPGDTYERRMGTSYQINMLFGSLLEAAGLEVRVAQLPRRDDRFFDERFLNPYFLNGYAMAVRVDGEWRFYDAGSPYVSPGMLLWPEEGVLALVTDPKRPEFVRTPLTEPEGTTDSRFAELELAPDGTLSGSIREVVTGHRGVSAKRIYDGLSEDERVERVTKRLQNRLSTAEVTDVVINNADSVDGVFSYSYKISVPGYAVPTGKRLFLQPSFFERNTSARFATSERKHDIYFSYPFSEKDHVVIRMPEGYELEDAEAPQSFQLGEFGEYTVRLATTSTGNLIYNRTFVWGVGGMLLFPASSYPQLKGAFDEMHKQDEHMVTLRPADSATEGR